MAQLSYQATGFCSRSWSMLRRDAGWYKPLLVLTVAFLVPVIGPLATMGYAFEWARLSAWGFESAPKQRNVQIGTCIKSGWRAFVVILAYTVPAVILYGLILNGAPRSGALSDILNLVLGFLWFVWEIIAQIAALTAVIYQRISAGFAFKRVFGMVSRSDKSFWSLVLSIVLFELIISVIAFAIVFVVLMGSLPIFVTMAQTFFAGEITSPVALTSFLSSLALPITVCILVTCLLSVVRTLLVPNAIGLWMMQFRVPEWGDANSELPDEFISATSTNPAPATPVAGEGFDYPVSSEQTNTAAALTSSTTAEDTSTPDIAAQTTASKTSPAEGDISVSSEANKSHEVETATNSSDQEKPKATD